MIVSVVAIYILIFGEFVGSFIIMELFVEFIDFDSSENAAVF